MIGEINTKILILIYTEKLGTFLVQKIFVIRNIHYSFVEARLNNIPFLLYLV